MPQLRVTSPALRGAVFNLAGDYFTVGREPDNSIRLDHTSVSKHHAILKADGGDFQLLDLHSTNGVIVNGERRVVAHLREGDRIQLGEVELHFEAERREETQRLTLPMIEKPEPKLPPAPKPPATRALPEASDPPPSRETIHAGFSETLGKMGLGMPNPPPPPVHGPTERKRATLPPLPAASPAKAPGPRPAPAPAVKAVAEVETKPVVPEPTPPIVTGTVAGRFSPQSRLRQTFTTLLVAGIVLTGLGYLLQVYMMKFVGLLAGVTGLVGLIFSMRFGRLVAPPKP
jgi:predicted component of type VI protein secretion system